MEGKYRKYQRQMSVLKRKIQKERIKLRTEAAIEFLNTLPKDIRDKILPSFKNDFHTKRLDLRKLEHDVTVAEGNAPKLKPVEIPCDLLKDKQAAEDFFKKFKGRCTGKKQFWTGEVDPYLWTEKEEVKNEGRKNNPSGSK